MEVADRAVVDRGTLAIALPRHRSLFRAERGRSMTEAGKRVQCRAAQGNDAVEGQEGGRQKLIRAPTGQESTSLEVTASCHCIEITPPKPDRQQRIDGIQFDRTTVGLSIGFRDKVRLFVCWFVSLPLTRYNDLALSQPWRDVTYLDFSGRCQAVATRNAGQRSLEIDTVDDSNGEPVNA
jgi:hypothetical protein